MTADTGRGWSAESPAAPAWDGLLRSEVDRLGIGPDAAAQAVERLLGQTATPAKHRTQQAAVGPGHSWRWADRVLPLGERTLIMGVINVTDDSLSGDGLGRDVGAVVARAEALVAAGADILDVGGESTRPGAAPVPAAEERARVEPAVAAIAR